MSVADPRGVPVSTGTADLIDQLEAAHELSLSFRGDPVAAIDKTLQRNPDFIMGHCFKAGLLTQAMETRIYEPMCASLNAAEVLPFPNFCSTSLSIPSRSPMAKRA